jgi:hypothetical protein
MYNLIQEKRKIELVRYFGHDGIFDRLGRSYNALHLALKEKHKNNTRQAFNKELNDYKKAIAIAEKIDTNSLVMSGKDCKELYDKFSESLYTELEKLAS